ncbi:TPA: autotransporter-associated beta strand repeat-containing protein, partial [Escherichia coli]|nr:autotransporter-associated beta strand repeat-containing protein [Escherichia coli]
NISADGVILLNQGNVLGGTPGSINAQPGKAIVVSGKNSHIINDIGGEIRSSGLNSKAVEYEAGADNGIFEMRTNSIVDGVVDATKISNSKLVLGGNTAKENSTFIASKIGNRRQYQGFSNYEVNTSEGSTWNLIGETTALTPWTVTEGTLAIVSDHSLGSTDGALTLNGGVLQTVLNVNSDRRFNLTAESLNGGILTDGDLTLTNVISGVGGLKKTGNATLILGGQNDYTGRTIISSGNLFLTGEGGIEHSESVELSKGTSLNISSTTGGTMVNNLTGDEGSHVVLGDRFLTVNSLADSVFSGEISGNGSLIKKGQGDMTLDGINSYQGITRIDQGNLRINSDQSLGGGNKNNSDLIMNGGGLKIFGSFASDRDVYFNADGDISVDKDMSSSWNKIHTGDYKFTKSGEGELIVRNGGDASEISLMNGALTLINLNMNSEKQDALLNVNNGVLNIIGGDVSAKNDLIYITGDSTINLDNVSIKSSGNGMRLSDNVQSTLSLRNQYTDMPILVEGKNSILNINAGDNTTLASNMHKSDESTINLNLMNNSSNWVISQRTDVDNVRNSGNIIFSPLNKSEFNNLNIKGDYSGGNGTITLNTVLNKGGDKDQQLSDKVLIKGNVSGETVLKVVPQGNGDNTASAPGNIFSSRDGISLVQVGGDAADNAFKLDREYISTGTKSPYQYRLFTYRGDQVDQQSNFLGDKPVNVDFRLQTAYLDSSGNVVPGVDPDYNNSNNENGNGTGNDNGTGNGTGNGNTGERKSRPLIVRQASSYLSLPAALSNYSNFVLDNIDRRLGDIYSKNNNKQIKDFDFYYRFITSSDSYKSNLDLDNYGYD